ncbi:MAG: glutamine-hydrolyzing GMP synthase [Promethearchaeota archaeon]
MEDADTILVLDFGGQYCHLISRRVRDIGVYSEILPFDKDASTIFELRPKGIVLSGGPSSVYEEGSPKLPAPFLRECSERGIPVLGLCYGHQLIAQELGGKVEPHSTKEYGKTRLTVDDRGGLFWGLEKTQIVWMSHGDQVVEVPEGCRVTAHTEMCPVAAFACEEKKLYGLQFHPEVVHTLNGNQILDNFVTRVCGCEKNWRMHEWIPRKVEEVRGEVGDKQVILGLSGGVDSSTVAALLHEAIGEQLHCVFVNNGVLRKGEAEDVVDVFRDQLGFANFHYVDAEDLFLERLKGVSDPEEKRKIIGHTFIEVFEQKARELEGKYASIEYLAQGTIFPDRVETAATSKSSAKIKSHHNVTLPDTMKLKLVEPLKDLYKDEVRKIGRELGLPETLIKRHPFPGPGLAVRCIGPVTKERLDILREADAILIEEIRAAELYDDLWQAFAVFIPAKSVGVMGDFRTYEYICAIRVVESRDAMTANFAKLPWDLLERVSTRIINEVKGFNRVVYDISNKPPSTIEFE